MQDYPDQLSNLGYTPTERVWYPANEYNGDQLYLNVLSNNEPTLGNSWTPILPPPPKKRNTLKLVITTVFGIILLSSILIIIAFISYNYGNSDGYARGHNAGYSSGYSNGQSDGYTKGHSDGYDSGHAQGLTDGYQSGETNGYTSGYSAGETYIECWVMQNHPYVYSWYFNNAFAGTTCP